MQMSMVFEFDSGVRFEVWKRSIWTGTSACWLMNGQHCRISVASVAFADMRGEQ